MTKQELQTALDHLADLCLENEGPHFYENKDLVNATLVFTHFLMDHIWQANVDMTNEGREKVALRTGEAIRELIKASTDKDMHELIKL